MAKVVKEWIYSRSVWSGILKILAGIMISGSQLLIGEIEPQAFITGLISAGWGVYDIYLRFNTNEAII
jgi:hypothetical protein